LIAQHLRHERHQLAKRANACYLPRCNVLDPADHPTGQSGTHVQVYDEGAVGAQFEPDQFRGRGRGGSRNVALSHTPTLREGAVADHGTRV